MALTDEGIIEVPGMASMWVRLGSGAKAHYMFSGENGPAVVLLHGGLPGSSGAAGWRFMAPYLAEQGFRVYCPDMPAYGLSDPSPEYAPQGLHSFVDFIQEFTTAVGIDKFHIAGNSMGCMNAVNYTTAHPERVLSVILIAGDVGDITNDMTRPEGNMHLAEYDGTREGMRKMMTGIIYKQEAVSDDVIEMRYQASMVHRENQAALWPSFMAYLNRAPWPDENIRLRLSTKGRFDKMTIPCIYLFGVNDVLIPVEWGFAQEDCLPNVQFFYPEECGHQGQTDRPDIFNPIFAEFFKTGKVSRALADAAGVSKRRPENPNLVEQV